MKILFVAVFKEGSTNVSQSNALKRCGHNVTQLDYRLNWSEITPEDVARSIVCIVAKNQYDVVLFSKCNGIGSWVIDECNKHAKTALWYMDPLNGNFNAELIEKIKKCNYTFCALQKPCLEAMKYSGNVHFVHEGFDPDTDYPMVSDTEPKAYNATFIGNLRGERAKYHHEIGFKNTTDCFGKAHAAMVGMSKINLNFVDGYSGCSDRVYKVLAAKGFLLTQPWPGMEKDFTVGEDLIIFNGIGDLAQKIEQYSKPEERETRMRIAESGYRKVQKFSRNNWARRIINIVEGAE